MDMGLLKFDIYQVKVALNALRAIHTLDVLIFFKIKVLSDVRSEIHLI